MAELTPAANRAARGILKWAVRDLANRSGISFTTVHRFETTGTATDTTKRKIVSAYANFGVEITNGEGTGARLRVPKVGMRAAPKDGSELAAKFPNHSEGFIITQVFGDEENRSPIRVDLIDPFAVQYPGVLLGEIVF